MIATEQEQFALDVSSGLNRTHQRELPSQYLYDALGSALFDAITYLPEYGLTRADQRLLHRLSPALAEWLPPGAAVAELGSGSGTKTRSVLAAMARTQPVSYQPIDVSVTALARCAAELADVAEVRPLCLPYLDGLRAAVRALHPQEALLVLFLGSSIGNFSAEGARSFLHQVRTILRPGDQLLLGADLVKDIPRMLLAYDDPTGVSAAFNRNVLGRINRELGGNFDLRAYAHEARYDRQHQRMEMHLRALRDQRVFIPGAETRFTIGEGESIWTESSHKYTLLDLTTLARHTGFEESRVWVDEEWPFAECLWSVTG